MATAAQTGHTTRSRPGWQTADRQDTPAVMPERRDLHFLPPADRINDWHGRGAHHTQFFNALSLFFPAGERMFIDAVRRYRDAIPDPELKRAATAFIGQEAMHSREHEQYNQMMADSDMPAKTMETFIWSLLDWVKGHTPKAFPLSGTIALEHYTALMGSAILDNPETLLGSQEHYKQMWFWHAMEEIEHKAVAFDVYEQTIGRGPGAYALRTAGLVIASGIFWPLLALYYVRMTHASPECKQAGWRGHLEVANTFFGKPGIFRRKVPDLLAYLKYGFHPWQQDNSHYLAQLGNLAARTQAAHVDTDNTQH